MVHLGDLVETETEDGTEVVLVGEESRSEDLILGVLGVGVEEEATEEVGGGSSGERGLDTSLHDLGGEVEGQDSVGVVGNEEEVIVDGGVGEAEVVGVSDGGDGAVRSGIGRENFPGVVLQAKDLAVEVPLEGTVDHDRTFSSQVQETVLSVDQGVGTQQDILSGSRTNNSLVDSVLVVAQDLVVLEARNDQVTVGGEGQTVGAVQGSVSCRRGRDKKV